MWSQLWRQVFENVKSTVWNNCLLQFFADSIQSKNTLAISFLHRHYSKQKIYIRCFCFKWSNLFLIPHSSNKTVREMKKRKIYDNNFFQRKNKFTFQCYCFYCFWCLIISGYFYEKKIWATDIQNPSEMCGSAKSCQRAVFLKDQIAESWFTLEVNMVKARRKDDNVERWSRKKRKLLLDDSWKEMGTWAPLKYDCSVPGLVYTTLHIPSHHSHHYHHITNIKAATLAPPPPSTLAA